jgi:hypothetical protein
MASAHGDLITCHLVGSRRGGRREHHTLASLTGHLMPGVLLAIAFWSHWVVREVEAHARQAESPHPQGVMMAGKDRARSIGTASLAGCAQGALPLG